MARWLPTSPAPAITIFMSCTLVFVFGNRHALLLRDKRSGPGDRAVCSPYGPATRLVSDPWPAVLPRRCRNLSHRSAVLPFFSQKPNPACGSARRIRPLVRRTRIRAARGSARPFRATAAGSLPFGAYAVGAGLAVPFPGDRDGGIVRYGGIGAEYAQRGGRRNRSGEFCRLFHFVTVTE